MSEETAVAEYSADTKDLGDKIADMTLKQAKEFSSSNGANGSSKKIILGSDRTTEAAIFNL